MIYCRIAALFGAFGGSFPATVSPSLWITSLPLVTTVFLTCDFFLLKIPFHVTERIVVTAMAQNNRVASKSSLIQAPKHVRESTDPQQPSIEQG